MECGHEVFGCGIGEGPNSLLWKSQKRGGQKHRRAAIGITFLILGRSIVNPLMRSSLDVDEGLKFLDLGGIKNSLMDWQSHI